MSSVPDCAAAIARPVPFASKLMVIHGYCAWNKSLMSSFMTVPFAKTSGVSSNPVWYRLVVVATVRVTGEGIGVGDGIGEAVADGEGVGVGVAVGECEGEAVGLGDREIVGEEDGVGVGVGVGEGLELFLYEYAAYAPTAETTIIIRIRARTFWKAFIFFTFNVLERHAHISITAGLKYSKSTIHRDFYLIDRIAQSCGR